MIVKRAFSSAGSEMLFVIDPELIGPGDRIQAKKNYKNKNQSEKY